MSALQLDQLLYKEHVEPLPSGNPIRCRIGDKQLYLRFYFQSFPALCPAQYLSDIVVDKCPGSTFVSRERTGLRMDGLSHQSRPEHGRWTFWALQVNNPSLQHGMPPVQNKSTTVSRFHGEATSASVTPHKLIFVSGEFFFSRNSNCWL